MATNLISPSYFLIDRSPQLSRRSELVDWLSRVADCLALGRCTLHLAVKILDYFMDAHDILVSMHMYRSPPCIDDLSKRNFE